MLEFISVTLVSALLVLCGLAGTTGVVAVADGAQQSKSTPAAPAEVPAAPKTALEWTGIPKVSLENPTLHRGIVLGPDGHPLPGASIYAASTIELLEISKADKVGVKDLGPVRAVTDAQGRFEFDAQDLSWVTPAGIRKRWETLLVAARDGVATGWIATYGDDRTFRSHWNPFPGKDVAIRTRPPATLAGAFSLEGGTPLANARVRVTGLFAPIEYDLDRHIAREEKKEIGLFSGINYAESLHRPWLLPGLKTEATTDKDGRFELPSLPEGFIAELEVAHPQAVTTRLRVAVRPIEPVYRKSSRGREETTPTLYGSDFKIELEKGVILRGEVTSDEFGSNTKAAGISVVLANHNSPDGMAGRRFKTDSEGRFLVTGLAKNLEGYELAFAGSFAAPFRSGRQRIVAGIVARVELDEAVRYRLKLTDREGNPIDRTVFSVDVQKTPGTTRRDIKTTFNDAERVASGVYEGIVPIGPGAVLVKRGKKTDRPAAVNPKAFFEPGRTDWTPEEERYAYGDAWHIATPGVSMTDMLAATANPLEDQLGLAAAVFTKASKDQGVLELTAVVDSDPPVKFTLVDLAGKPVENVRVNRLANQDNADKLPSNISVHGLHPERAEPLQFFQDQGELIATVLAKWTAEPVRVVLQPAATLTGRFVDPVGQPKFDFGIRVLGPVVMPDTFVAGRRLNTTDKPGERSGEFRQVLTPGFEVRGEFVRYAFYTLDWKTRPALGPAFGPVIPKPGETIDLGNIKSP